MARVRLGNFNRTFDAREVGDLDTYQAVEAAKGLRSSGFQFSEAFVDRTDGLIIVGRDGSWHFTTTICGYGGTGPMATAEILELFGFGVKADILKDIDHGGDNAKFSFKK